jgi:hypothetical protein
MKTRAPKSNPFRRPTTESEIDAAIEQVRRETSKQHGTGKPFGHGGTRPDGSRISTTAKPPRRKRTARKPTQ